MSSDNQRDPLNDPAAPPPGPAEAAPNDDADAFLVALIDQETAVVDLFMDVVAAQAMNPSEAEEINLKILESRLRLEWDRLVEAIDREIDEENPTPLRDPILAASILENIKKVEQLTLSSQTISALIDLTEATLELSGRLRT